MNKQDYENTRYLRVAQNSENSVLNPMSIKYLKMWVSMKKNK